MATGIPTQSQPATKPGAVWRAIRLAVLQIGAVVLVICLVGEAWSRLSPPKDEMVWPLVQNDAVGTTFRPNARVMHTNGLDFRVEAYANEVGFLDRPLPPLAKPPASCRVALIGDSFVEAAQVPVEEKVQVKLQRLLEQRAPDLKVETMAVGYSGTGQLNQLGYLEAFVRPRKPDVIVLVFVSNDFANNSALLEAIRVGWHPAHTPRIFARETGAVGEPGSIELQPIDPDWMRHRLPKADDERPWLHRKLHRISRFYRWFYKKLTLQYPAIARAIGGEPTAGDRTMARIQALKQRVSPELRPLLDGWDPRTSPSIDAMFGEPDPLPGAFQQALRFTGFAFDTFKQRAEADGARLIVISTHGVVGRLAGRLAAMLSERDIAYVSLHDHIQRSGGKISQAHWKHDGHWSPQGHVWAAEALAQEIAKNGPC